MSNGFHSAPATDAAAVTSSNTTNLSPMARGLWIGGAGNVSVVFDSFSEVTIEGIPAGTLLPVRVRRVNQTGTSATSILALY